MGYHVLMCSIKDEGPFLLEWVAHHRTLGFDAIYIASNDCTDGSDILLDALAGQGFISGHLRHVVPKGVPPIHAGYAALRRAFDIDRAEWLAALDVDEFLNVHVGQNKVQDLTALAQAEVDVISLNGCVFSSLGPRHWQAGRVCAQFQLALPRWHLANGALKSITRNPSRFAGAHSHHLSDYLGAGPLRIMRGDGLLWETDPSIPLPRQLRHRAATKTSQIFAQYNHYAVRSYDTFLLRRSRGRGGLAQNKVKVERYSDAYFEARSHARKAETSISRYAPLVEAQMALMLAHSEIATVQARIETAFGAACAKAVLASAPPHL